MILGLDPSIKKAGYCLLDTDASYDSFVDKGRLKTSGLDGILVQKLILQADRIKALIQDNHVAMIAMEAPYFEGRHAEKLFALNQFIHRTFLETGAFVIAFPPQQMKVLACPGKKAQDIHKAQMVAEAKRRYHLQGKILPDDEADAMHAAHLGKLFYNWHFAKKLTDKDLHPEVFEAFAGKKVYTRGPRKGVTEYSGLIYRENELFFDFKRIAERKEEYGIREENNDIEGSAIEGIPGQEDLSTC
jgi:Holliday junction resolvasome RuvABC endonuclease subunit